MSLKGSSLHLSSAPDLHQDAVVSRVLKSVWKAVSPKGPLFHHFKQ